VETVLKIEPVNLTAQPTSVICGDTLLIEELSEIQDDSTRPTPASCTMAALG
jgi:hypothetical protein